MKQSKGITLIALVITIIILLILAEVAIATLTGENGLIGKVKIVKQNQIKAEMKEQLTIKLSELQIEKSGEATLNDITQSWADTTLNEYKAIVVDVETTNSKKVTMSKNEIVGNYIIDEKLNIIETEGNAEVELTYKIKSRNGNNLEVLVTVTDKENGIQSIEYNDGHIQQGNGKKSIARDCTIQIGIEYKIKITSKNGAKAEKTILLEEAKEIDIPEEIEISLGQTETIKPTLTPINAIAEINWTIEDNTIAELKNGTIKGIKLGNTTVTASVTLQDGSTIKDTCTINVYQKVTTINTAEELRAFAQEVNNGKSFENELVKLEKDIDLGGKQEDESTWWTPIGYYNSSTDYMYFKGTFDGQNHEISKIYIKDAIYKGSLFIDISGATIRNLGVTNSYIKGKYAAAITGNLRDSSKVENCYCKESQIIGNGGMVAGISLQCIDGKISNCYNSSEIYFYRLNKEEYYMKVAGITGGMYNTNNGKNEVENCYNKGNITVEEIDNYGLLRGGGICGSIENGGQLKNSYNAGRITFTSTRYSGIIIGACDTNSITQNCYSLENVSNMNEIGLCNYVYGGGRLINCSALTDSYMKTQNFVNDLNEGNTKGNLAWKLNPNGGYPILQWQ